MAKVKVYWTKNALKAVEVIGDYIAKDVPERAIEFTDRLLESTSRLENFPLSGSSCKEDTTCRQVVVEGYSVIYEVTERGVEVLTVVGPGQNPIQLK
ncbi:MAG: type II toxin-antitoxin system RelE/ParE family toxin [Pyrinomonadaceae bacterium]